MTGKINLNSSMQRIYNAGAEISIPTFIIITIAILGLIASAVLLELELYLLIVLLGLSTVWAVIFYPRLWIYIITLGMFFFPLPKFYDEIETNTATYVFIAVFYDLFLGLWFINKLLIKRQKIALNIMDYLILFFYAMVVFGNSIIAYLNGVNLVTWMTEFFLYSLLLFYFPIREYFDKKEYIFLLLFCLAVVAFALDIRQFYFYQEGSKNIKFAFQVFSGSIRFHQEYYTAVVFSAIVFFFYAKSIKWKLFSFVTASLTAATLISTISRAFWIALIAMLIVYLPFLKIKQAVQMLAISLIFAIGAMFIIQQFMPERADFMYKFVVNRLASSNQGKSDLSIRARVQEAKAIDRLIKENPLGGYGMAKKFSYISKISQVTSYTTFVHNSFLDLAYKVGIPLTAIFFVAIALYLIKGFFIVIRTKSDLHRSLAICGFASLLMLFMTSFVTSSFFYRSGGMTSAFAVAFIGIADEYYKKEINKKS